VQIQKDILRKVQLIKKILNNDTNSHPIHKRCKSLNFQIKPLIPFAISLLFYFTTKHLTTTTVLH